MGSVVYVTMLLVWLGMELVDKSDPPSELFLVFKGTIVGILRVFFVDSAVSDAAISSLKLNTRLLFLRLREYVLVAGVEGLLLKLAVMLSSTWLLAAAGGGGDLRGRLRLRLSGCSCSEERVRIRSAADTVDWSEVLPLTAPDSESVGWSVDMSVVDGLGSMSLP